jgi:phosphatidate cytidylyltransferase
VWLICAAPLWLFSTVVLLCTVLGLHEYFSLPHAAPDASFYFGVTWGLAVAGALVFLPSPAVGAVLVAGLFCAFFLSLRDPQPSQGVRSVSEALLGVVYVGLLTPHLALIRTAPDGVGWTLFVFVVAMLGDTAGYAAGRTWGRHKLIPHISPGKTVEGSVGSFVGNLFGAGVMWYWFFPYRSLGELLFLGIVAGGLAQVGDLCESAIKRAFGAKDSGHLLPGHGGILDRLDSLLFPAAFIYYYGKAWG